MLHCAQRERLLREAAEDTIVQVTLQSLLLDGGADVLAVDKMSRCGLLPGKYKPCCRGRISCPVKVNQPVECKN